jgi:hypothetical protein
MKPWMERGLLLLVLVLGFVIIHYSTKEAFATIDPIQKESCDYITEQRTWFYDKLSAVRQMSQELRRAMDASMAIKAENMLFQYSNWEAGILGLNRNASAKCSESNTSPDCIMLATVDSNVAGYAQLTGQDLLEVARNKMNTLDTVLNDELKRLTNNADVLGCPDDALSLQIRTFDTSRDIAYFPVATLREKLRELSPYYIDPSLLTVLLSYLIDDPRFLTRVKTVEGQSSNVIDNMNEYWLIAKSSANADSAINREPAPASSSEWQNFLLTPASDNIYACGIRGGYAEVATRSFPGTGRVDSMWISDRSNVRQDERKFAFGDP